MFSNLRIVLLLTYLAALFWPSGGVSRGVPDDWWLYLVSYSVLSTALYFAERLHGWWQWRRAVQRMRSLDPAVRDARFARMWLSGVRRQLASRVRDEGEVEVVDGLERFPFARGAQRAVATGFWTCAAIGVALQVVLIAGVPHVRRPVGWVMLVIGTLFTVAAAWTRVRLRHMETVLEVSLFAIAEVQPNGVRRSYRWADPLLLRGRPHLRRLELSMEREPGYISLDYDRVGIDRAVQIVLERGGFRSPEEEIGA